MTKLRSFLAGAVIAALAAAAVAQTTIVQTAISGNEVWRAAQGPGGSESYIGINTVRNSSNINTTSGSGSATSTGTGGTLVWTGTAPTTWTVTLPTAPANGTKQRVTTHTTLTSLVTVQAGGSDTLAATFASQTLTADTTVVAWQYNSANTTWYRIQ